jgi:hypothetical protein
MDDIVKAIFSAPIATLLIVAGLGFLVIAVLGKIGNLLEAGKTERFASGAIGTTLLIVGLSIHLKTALVNPSPTSPVITATPSPPNASIQPTKPLSPTLANSRCLQQYLQDIPHDRMMPIESGAQDVQIIQPDQLNDQPVGILLTENGKPVSAIKFQFYSSGQFFKVRSVVDAQCNPVEDYRNTSRGGDKHVLKNWDDWKVQLENSAYTIRFGYSSDNITLNVNRSSPTP